MHHGNPRSQRNHCGVKRAIFNANSRHRAMGAIIGPMNGVEMLDFMYDAEVVATLSDFRCTYLDPMEDFVNFLEDSLSTLNDVIISVRDVISRCERVAQCPS